MVVHHRNGDLSPVQANTTRAARVGIPQAISGGTARPHDQSEDLTCGNDDRSQPGSSCRPGPDGGIRTAPLRHRAGTVTASRCCPEVPVPQPQPREPAQVTLAAELKPHKTELNPLRQLRRLSVPEQIRRAFRARPEPAGMAAGKGAVTPPAVCCAHDAPLPPRAELAHA